MIPRQPISPDNFASAMLDMLQPRSNLTAIFAQYYRHIVATAWDNPTRPIYPPLAWLELMVAAKGTRATMLRKMEQYGLITRDAALKSTIHVCQLAAYQKGRYYPYTIHDYFGHLYGRWPRKHHAYLAAFTYRRIWQHDLPFAQGLALEQPVDMPLHEYLLIRAGRPDLITAIKKTVPAIDHISPTSFVPPPSGL